MPEPDGPESEAGGELGMMTVGELIARLQREDPTLRVVLVIGETERFAGSVERVDNELVIEAEEEPW